MPIPVRVQAEDAFDKCVAAVREYDRINELLAEANVAFYVALEALEGVVAPGGICRYNEPWIEDSFEEFLGANGIELAEPARDYHEADYSQE